MVLPFVPGSLVGVPLGLWVVKNADQGFLVRLLGAYVIAYAVYSLFGERVFGRTLTMPRFMVHPLSVAGALIATLFGGLAGPIYVTYFDSLKLASECETCGGDRLVVYSTRPVEGGVANHVHAYEEFAPCPDCNAGAQAGFWRFDGTHATAPHSIQVRKKIQG